MKNKPVILLGAMALLASLSACGFVGQQLADKTREGQLLQSGALDRRMTDVYDTYQFKFLDKYRITHEWPRNSKGCQYAGLSTLNVKDGSHGEFYAIRDIYEEGGSTKQRDAHPTWNFDRFVRPTYKRQIPEFDAAGKKTGRILEKDETGFEAVCFEAWVGTSHSAALRLYKSTLNERIAFYSKRSGAQSREEVGTQTWWVWRYPIDEDNPKAYGGQAWVRPIGDTGYTLALELGAGPESLKFPQAHANFQAMFRHLIESVKIEPLQP